MDKEESNKKHIEFQASSNTWLKYSDYEIYKDKITGGLWIKPKPNTSILRYEPFEEINKRILLKDIIDLGKELEEHYEAYDSGISFSNAFVIPFIKYSNIQRLEISGFAEICKVEKKKKGDYYIFAADKILKFVNSYGLLGLYSELDPTSLSLNNTYTETMRFFFPHLQEQFIPRNNIDSEEFWSNYSEPVALIEQFARHIFFLSQVDNYFNKRRYIVGGKTERLHLPDDPCDLDTGITWGEWFETMMHVDDISIRPKYNKKVQIKYTNEKEVKSFNWQVDWLFPSLHKAISLIQVLNFMSEYQFVKTCRCGEVFIATDKRADYCGPACRNRCNVRNSRNLKG